MKRTGLSLKYKLLVILILIPLLALSIYAFVAIDLFRKDKIAYVFDSSATVATSLAAQVRSEIQSWSSSVKSYVIGYQLNIKKFNQSSKQTFVTDPMFDYLAVYHFEKDRFLLGDRLKKEKFRPKNNWIEKDFARQILNEVRDNNFSIRKLSDKKVVLGFGSSDGGTRTAALAVINSSVLSDIFLESRSFDRFLVNSSGNVVFGSNDVKDFKRWQFQSEMVEQSFSERTIESVTPDQEEIFISYAKLGVGGLSVVSMLTRKKALVAVKLLFTKSILFFFAILSASFIVSILASNRLTSALRRLFFATRKVADGNYDVEIEVKSKDEVGQLAESFNSMATEVSRLMSENIEKARMEKELETAKAVQDALFPNASGKIGPVEVEGYYTSASECGGDWWHYSEHEGRAFLWIGDATGHGAPAALITSAAKSVASVAEDMSELTPAKAMTMLNTSICKNSKGKICMTFFIACIDSKSGEMTYCNASHEPPIKIPYKEDGKIKKMDLEPVMSESCARLGQSLESEYKDEKIQLNSGDSIYFYTDGVTELVGPDGSMFEERRLLRSLVAGFKKQEGIRSVMQRLDQDLQEFRGSTPYEDDVTYFMINYSPSESSNANNSATSA